MGSRSKWKSSNGSCVNARPIRTNFGSVSFGSKNGVLKYPWLGTPALESVGLGLALRWQLKLNGIALKCFVRITQTRPGNVYVVP